MTIKNELLEHIDETIRLTENKRGVKSTPNLFAISDSMIKAKRPETIFNILNRIRHEINEADVYKLDIIDWVNNNLDIIKSGKAEWDRKSRLLVRDEADGTTVVIGLFDLKKDKNCSMDFLLCSFMSTDEDKRLALIPSLGFVKLKQKYLQVVGLRHKTSTISEDMHTTITHSMCKVAELYMIWTKHNSEQQIVED